MEKQPGNRYAGAQELADDLSRFLANEPILARPTGITRRAAKWARCRPALAGLLATSVLAIVALGTVITVSNLRLKEERDAATAARDGARTQKLIADVQRDAANREKAEAEKQRQRAQIGFDRAREAIDQMLTRIGSEKLRNIPQLEEVRRELLEEALPFNKQFLSDQGDAPMVRRETARAYRKAV